MFIYEAYSLITVDIYTLYSKSRSRKKIHSYSGHQPICIIFVLEDPLGPPYKIPKLQVIHTKNEFLANF